MVKSVRIGLSNAAKLPSGSVFNDYPKAERPLTKSSVSSFMAIGVRPKRAGEIPLIGNTGSSAFCEADDIVSTSRENREQFLSKRA